MTDEPSSENAFDGLHRNILALRAIAVVAEDKTLRSMADEMLSARRELTKEFEWLLKEVDDLRAAQPAPRSGLTVEEVDGLVTVDQVEDVWWAVDIAGAKHKVYELESLAKRRAEEFRAALRAKLCGPGDGWTRSADRMPDYGQKCLVAQNYRNANGTYSWLPFTGWKSEQDDRDCWYVDDDDFIEVDDTWWRLIVAPDGRQFYDATQPPKSAGDGA